MWLKNIHAIGNSYLSRIKINSSSNRKPYWIVFWGSTIKRLKHFAEPTLLEDKPDVFIMHFGCNDITKQIMHSVDPIKLAHDIVIIRILCGNSGIKKIIYWIDKDN